MIFPLMTRIIADEMLLDPTVGPTAGRAELTMRNVSFKFHLFDLNPFQPQMSQMVADTKQQRPRSV
jgi:hypothetical protein